MARLWPTATAQDGNGHAQVRRDQAAIGKNGGTTLAGAVLDPSGLWARPQARDWKDSGPTQGNRKSPNLGTQVSSGAMFPTPKAADGRSKGTGGSPDHGLDAMARAGLLDPESHSTSGKSRDCDTTPSQDSGPASPDSSTPNSWLTPNQCDGTAGHQMGETTSMTGRRPDGTKANVTLPGVMKKLHGPTRGVLNSRWVLQLMGYPSTWCDVPGDSIAKPSRRRATPSSRKSSRRSAAPSSRRKV
jgi:hypothetical protein